MAESIRWTNEGIVLLDQRQLPAREVYLTCQTVEDVAGAIESLAIRGAPAISIAAAMGVALAVSRNLLPDEIETVFEAACTRLSATRPTARNLFWAIERMRAEFDRVKSSSLQNIQKSLAAEAERIKQEDLAINRTIGRLGAGLLPARCGILTHCNTGSLATAGYGTALGIIRAAHAAGKEVHVYVDETRPLLQGSRLTAWELQREQIPCTLITDSMAGYFMRLGRIDAVVVGADRIAANGDVANKIGTYTVALLARAHDIPFYVAAPTSTIDQTIGSGEEIEIEQRDIIEVTSVLGTRIAPVGVDAANPAFDVTPSLLVSALITEKGIIRAPYQVAIKAL